MPTIQITVCSPIRDSFRVQQVRGLFGLPEETENAVTLTAELPGSEEEWTIGAIVGPSGSGKTTIASAAYGSQLAPHVGRSNDPSRGLAMHAWSADRAVIDGFGDGPIKAITELLAAVGFGCPKAWLRPYHVLSNGEKFRCDLARRLLMAAAPAKHDPRGQGRLVVFDEFSSLVDRGAARCASAAISRLIHRQNRATPSSPIRFVAITCHDDVLPWLETDWVLDMGTGQLTRGRLRRPRVELEVVRCRQSLWPQFARHHYLGGGLARSATCYAAVWDGAAAAFCAVVGQPGCPGRKRISRLVTLPNFQGLGIGMRLAERVAEYQQRRGFTVGITASHPAIIAHCRRSPRWRAGRVKYLGAAPHQLGRRSIPTSSGRGVAAFTFQPFPGA